MKKQKRRKSKRALNSSGPAFVEIRIDSNGDAFIPDCGVSKANRDEVRWISDYGPWKIHFNPGNQPFADADFFIPSGGGASAWSGPATGSRKRYPYSIRSRTKEQDPNIIIK